MTFSTDLMRIIKNNSAAALRSRYEHSSYPKYQVEPTVRIIDFSIDMRESLRGGSIYDFIEGCASVIRGYFVNPSVHTVVVVCDKGVPLRKQRTCNDRAQKADASFYPVG